MKLQGREPLRLQEQISDPDVLAVVVESNGYEVSSKLKTTPTDTTRIMKHGKVAAAASLAACTSDQNLLDKLCRDNRLGVRESLLQNPNLTQDHIEEVARRSLKRDKHYDVFAAAADRLDTDRLLPLVQSLIVRKIATQRNIRGVEINSQEVTGLDGTVNGVQSLHDVLLGRLHSGGPTYLKKLLSIGYEDFVDGGRVPYSQDHSRVDWHSPGMLEWMAPAIRPELVSMVLYTLLQQGCQLSPAEVDAASTAMRALPEVPQLPATFVHTQTPQELDTHKGLIALGHGWEQYAYRNAYAPNSIRMEAMQLADDEDLGILPVPYWGNADHYAWNPSPEALAAVEDQYPEFEWFSADLANYIAERLAQSPMFDERPGSGYQHPVLNRLDQVLYHVHPEDRHNITIEALALCECAGAPSVGPRQGHRWGQALSDWVAGKLPDKPTADKVGHVLAILRRARSGSERAFFEKVLEARRISLILGRPQQEIYGGGGEYAMATYMVFQAYFGDNVEAWQTGLQLHTDWDESLVELAETTCAIVGLDLPTEFDDLADLEAATIQDEDKPADDEDSPESEDIVQDESEQEPADAEDASTSEETVEPDSEEPDDTDVDTTSDEENDTEEALAPLDITDSVQFSLF